MENLKLWIKNVFGWLVLNPHLSIIIGAMIAGAIILFFVFSGISSCRDSRTEKKKAEINSNIIEKQTEANVLTNEKQAINADIKNANTNSKTALENVNKPRDSSVYSPVFDKAVKDWCVSIEFKDSLCEKYK